ncbi:hypothetical protein FZEAL_9427 [Fusarium zealandicum]|uniref:Uncharacterized protein n=1 Tax=Fusarium zealandicum TaxID=1053134 RepID=A0A8H4XGB4_9HYPO|nr:hypothetical protein FZEAL_9427 [Fusarium zealandicum]
MRHRRNPLRTGSLARNLEGVGHLIDQTTILGQAPGQNSVEPVSEMGRHKKDYDPELFDKLKKATLARPILPDGGPSTPDPGQQPNAVSDKRGFQPSLYLDPTTSDEDSRHEALPGRLGHPDPRTGRDPGLARVHHGSKRPASNGIHKTKGLSKARVLKRRNLNTDTHTQNILAAVAEPGSSNSRNYNLETPNIQSSGEDCIEPRETLSGNAQDGLLAGSQDHSQSIPWPGGYLNFQQVFRDAYFGDAFCLLRTPGHTPYNRTGWNDACELCFGNSLPQLHRALQPPGT